MRSSAPAAAVRFGLLESSSFRPLDQMNNSSHSSFTWPQLIRRDLSWKKTEATIGPINDSPRSSKLGILLFEVEARRRYCICVHNLILMKYYFFWNMDDGTLWVVCGSTWIQSLETPYCLIDTNGVLCIVPFSLNVKPAATQKTNFACSTLSNTLGRATKFTLTLVFSLE